MFYANFSGFVEKVYLLTTVPPPSPTKKKNIFEGGHKLYCMKYKSFLTVARSAMIIIIFCKSSCLSVERFCFEKYDLSLIECNNIYNTK